MGGVERLRLLDCPLLQAGLHGDSCGDSQPRPPCSMPGHSPWHLWGWTLPRASLLHQLGKTRILCEPEHGKGPGLWGAGCGVGCATALCSSAAPKLMDLFGPRGAQPAPCSAQGCSESSRHGPELSGDEHPPSHPSSPNCFILSILPPTSPLHPKPPQQQVPLGSPTASPVEELWSSLCCSGLAAVFLHAGNCAKLQATLRTLLAAAWPSQQNTQDTGRELCGVPQSHLWEARI